MIADVIPCGNPPFERGDQGAQMRDRGAELPLRAVDVDLLPRRARMIGAHRTNPSNLRACLLVSLQPRQCRRTDIAHLHILGQSREQLRRRFCRACVLLCLVQRICPHQQLLPSRRYVLHALTSIRFIRR